ncbi:mitogen-activated protein kinase kinase kinase 7-like isoform X2 [Gigantopelta aegis]|uniref:mitogen-activated protein kinase kinase kinase 7-like isoform X2 n=1 Tax=Gigantopelta aegis TaxID=1735272 RepID=UPI001B88B66D|nr:mitogen-activated protein kinase kinase kinase 7-like isoform X2 [Gigantopelta aegis]
MEAAGQSFDKAFAEEIDINELQFHEIVGKGAFGVVSRAKWRNIDVAVKIIETESEKKAFITELKQLSRVSHPNIVKLYGACTKAPVCLVMEYAEGGSLYNVLHGSGPQPNYTAAHAMSWAFQTAQGVEYLHNMRPKALIHRDLKPPNLLLIMGGTVLKICDFGTACDIQTHMTNNKGSAAWMAPEVFEGCNYSEKCDVFSWGIILWEVITRRKPFDEIGGPAFRIMWAVHNGKRPPLIRGLPKPLEILMTRCWSGNSSERPSMTEVVRIITHLFQFFKGADEPLVSPAQAETGDEIHYTHHLVMTSPDNHPITVHSPSVTQPMTESRLGTNSDTVKFGIDRGDPVPVFTPTAQRNTPPIVVEEGRSQKSAPPSLAASRESLHEPRGSRSGTPVNVFHRYSADLSKLEEYDIMSQANQPTNPQRVLGHRRSGSHGTPVVLTPTGPPNTPQPAGQGHRRIGSDEYTRVSAGTSSSSSTPRTGSPARMFNTVQHCNTYPGLLSEAAQGVEPPGVVLRQGIGSPPNRSISHPCPSNTKIQNVTHSTSWSTETTSQVPATAASPLNANVPASAMNMVYLSLDHQLQPLAPYPGHPESMAIFERHCQLAQQYVRTQTEIALLMQRKHELIKEFEQDEKESLSSTRGHLAEEYSQLNAENESLLTAHQTLKKQIEDVRKAKKYINHNPT